MRAWERSRSPEVQMKASADPTWSSGVTMVHGSGLSGGRGLASYPVSASVSQDVGPVSLQLEAVW